MIKAADAVPARPPAKAKAPSPILAEVPDDPRLPRVLLIGDSISMGYTLQVREKLAGKANVHRPAENCGDTRRGLQKLDAWLGHGHWDVIHFNFGLHDLKFLDQNGKYVAPEQGRQVATLAQYEENLSALVTRLKTTGAKLIFATTTPVPAGTLGRIERDETKYNTVALRVMKAEHVAVDDLDAFVLPLQEKIQRPKNVHFTEEGYALMADLVAKAIEAQLPTK
jgi:acyl-CoA thioesterase-1